MSGLKFSKYFAELQNDADKRRYRDKVSVLGCQEDPYCRMERKDACTRSVEWVDWPNVFYPDVYNYLISTPSEYTHEMLKAYKSMDGYNFFMNGWINNILVTMIDGTNKYIYTATVKHSQTLSASPLKVWVCCKLDGEVMAAHCTCMAGCGEACSHVAAVLFAAEANTIVKQQLSCTSLPCSWLPPAFRTVPFLPLAEIDFRTPKQKRKSFLDSEGAPAPKKTVSVPKPTEAKLQEHYAKLSKTKNKPLLLSLVSGFNDDFVPLYVRGLLPEPLTSLFHKDNEKVAFPDLLKACDAFYDMVSLTPQQAHMVELKTREQSKCKLWYEQRAGRVTASNLRKVLHTNFSSPSVSLLKMICYPESTKFYSKACDYGLSHEADALHMYNDSMQADHAFFELKKCGLVLDPSNPFIGASPDGITSCSCCGKGVVEVKCPFLCKDKSFAEAVKDKAFCLEEETFLLKQDHPYYFQVQLQMKLCNVKFCDFVVWGKDGTLKQRVNYDAKCIDDSLEQVKAFVKMCVLPELLSRCFTNKTVAPESSDEQDGAAESSDEQDEVAESSEQDEDIEDGNLPVLQPDDQPSSSTVASTRASVAENDEDNRL